MFSIYVKQSRTTSVYAKDTGSLSMRGKNDVGQVKISQISHKKWTSRS